MVIYQVLCTVPNDIEQDWREWMLDEHIRDVMNTEMFTQFRMSKVLKPTANSATQYCIQYYAQSMEDYEQYRKDFAPVLQAAHNAKYGNQISVERVVMESA